MSGSYSILLLAPRGISTTTFTSSGALGPMGSFPKSIRRLSPDALETVYLARRLRRSFIVPATATRKTGARATVGIARAQLDRADETAFSERRTQFKPNR